MGKSNIGKTDRELPAGARQRRTFRVLAPEQRG